MKRRSSCEIAAEANWKGRWRFLPVENRWFKEYRLGRKQESAVQIACAPSEPEEYSGKLVFLARRPRGGRSDCEGHLSL